MKRDTFLLNMTAHLILITAPLSNTAMTAQTSAPTAVEISQRELTFKHNDVHLEGDLYFPVEKKPIPAVVIMHGAGPETRQPYEADAKMLARHGVAAFIFDKRGTGNSTGDWQRSTLEELAGDGLAALEWVGRQPEIDPSKVGVLGISQGAWLAPFMAAASERVAFLIQVTGSATSLATQEMWAAGHALEQLGFSKPALSTSTKAFHLLYSSRDLIRRGILPLGDLWFVHYDPNLDPAEVWPKVGVPALVLFGAKDLTVPTASSVNILREVWNTHGHPKHQMVIFPEGGHALGGSSRNHDTVYTHLFTQWINAVLRDNPIPDLPYSNHSVSSDHFHWQKLASQETPWYATARIQLPLFLLFIVTFGFLTLFSLVPRISFGEWRLRLALGITGVVNTFVAIGLLYVLAYLLNADAGSAWPDIPLSGWLFALPWLAVILTLILTFLSFKSRGSSRLGSSMVAAGTVMAWGFIPFMAYWGLLGGKL